MFKNPEELKYTKTHEWVKEEDGLCVVGLTDGEVFCDVESVKAVSDVYSPVTGVIEEVNDALTDDPALVNNDCYDAWFIKVREVSGQDELLDAAAYEEFCKSEA